MYNGLTDEEVLESRKKYGSNNLSKVKKEGFLKLLINIHFTKKNTVINICQIFQEFLTDLHLSYQIKNKFQGGKNYDKYYIQTDGNKIRGRNQQQRWT